MTTHGRLAKTRVTSSPPPPTPEQIPQQRCVTTHGRLAKNWVASRRDTAHSRDTRCHSNKSLVHRRGWGVGVGGRLEVGLQRERGEATKHTFYSTTHGRQRKKKNWWPDPLLWARRNPTPSPTRQAYWKGKRAERQSGMLAGHRLSGAGQSGETIARAARESEGGWGANRGLFGVTGMVILISGVKRFHVLRLDLWRCPRADSVKRRCAPARPCISLL